MGPGLLALEITESAVMNDPERSLGILARLRQMGIAICIDDFRGERERQLGANLNARLRVAGYDKDVRGRVCRRARCFAAGDC